MLLTAVLLADNIDKLFSYAKLSKTDNYCLKFNTILS